MTYLFHTVILSPAVVLAGFLSVVPAASAGTIAETADHHCRDGGLKARLRDECATAIMTEVKQLADASDERLKRARTLIQEGNLAGAEDLLLAVVSADSDATASDRALALAALGALHAPRREALAIDFYERARALNAADVTDAIHLAKLYERRDDLARAEALCQSVLAAGRKSGRKPGFWQGRALLSLGDIAVKRKKGREAEAYYKQAIDLFTKLGRRSEQAAANASLGHLYLLANQFGVARLYLNRALAYYEEVGKKRSIARMCLNLGTAELRSGNTDAAGKYYERALPLFRELNDKTGQLATHFSMASVAMLRGNYEEAEAHNLKALDFARELKNASLERAALINLAITYDKSGDRAKACEYYAQAADKMAAASVPDDKNPARNLYLNRCSGVDQQVNRLKPGATVPASDTSGDPPAATLILDPAGRLIEPGALAN